MQRSIGSGRRNGSRWESQQDRAKAFFRLGNPWIYAAAVLAVCVVAYGLNVRATGTMDANLCARVVEVRGAAFTVRSEGAEKVPLSPGIQLQPGAEVVVERGAQVELEYADKTSLEIGENSRCWLLADPPRAKQIRLGSGVLRANVAPQPAEAPLRLFADGTETTVLGTRFRVEMARAQVRIDLYEGRVAFALPATGERLDLEAGFSAVAEGGRLAGPRSLQQDPGSSLAATPPAGADKDGKDKAAPVPENATPLNGLIPSLTLIDADTGAPVPGFEPLPVAAEVSLRRTGLQNFNIRIDATEQVASIYKSAYFRATDSSVERELISRHESFRPFAVFGDVVVTQKVPGLANYHKVPALPGTYRIVVRAYSDPETRRPMGEPCTFTFRIVE